MCRDGNPPPRPDLMLSDEAMAEFPGVTTCGELADSQVLLESDDCIFYQDFIGVGECDCIPSEDWCSVCPDRSVIPNPDHVLLEAEGPFDDDYTCRDLAFDAAFGGFIFEDDPGSCAASHIGAFACGCPLPDLTNPCSLCQDGNPSPTPESSVIRPGVAPNGTCSELEQATLYIDAESSVCLQAQLEGAYACSCPTPLEGLACSAGCPDGSLFSSPETVLEDFEETCFDFVVFNEDFSSPGDDCSFFYISTATLCGCPDPVPDETTCTLCSEELTEPDRIVEEFRDNVTTCLDVAIRLAYVDEGSDACRLFQSAAGASCGCPFMDITCTVCPDGTALPDPLIELYEDFTCRDVQINANAEPSTDFCDSWHIFANDCQCPAIQGGCLLCQDGSDPSRPDFDISFIGERTCQDLVDDLAFVAPESETCLFSQEFDGPLCGCPPLVGPCKLCDGGTADVPDPDLVYDEDIGETCGQLQSLYAFDDEESCLGARGFLSEELLLCCSAQLATDPPTDAPAVPPTDPPVDPLTDTPTDPPVSAGPTTAPSVGPPTEPPSGALFKNGAMVSTVLYLALLASLHAFF